MDEKYGNLSDDLVERFVDIKEVLRREIEGLNV
jgi:hypothetical protein